MSWAIRQHRADWLAQSNNEAASAIEHALAGTGVSPAALLAVAQRTPQYRGQELLLARLFGAWGRAQALEPRPTPAQTQRTVAELSSLATDHAALARRGDGAVAATRSAAESPAVLQSAPPAADAYTEMQAAFDAPLPANLQSRLTQRWQGIDQRAQRIAGQVDLNADTPAAKAINKALDTPRLRLATSHYPQVAGQQSAERSINNWFSAEATVLNAVRSNIPITAANIKSLNSVFGLNQPRPVVRGVTQSFGEYRTTPMAPGAFPNREYLPPESIERAMADFEAWYQRAEQSGMHPVQMAAQAYARLSSIHPFPDANGRTARLVMNWILRSHGLPPAALAPEHIDRMLEDVHGSNVVPKPGTLEQELSGAIERSLDTVERMLPPPPPRERERPRGFGR
jgi:Fic/DOC family